jgi:hypothetical protein
MIRSCETMRILVNPGLSSRFCNKDTAEERVRIPVKDALQGVAIHRK